MEVTRDYFVTNVVKRIMKKGPEGILCLYGFEKLGVFEVVLRSVTACVSALRSLRENKEDEALRGVTFEVCGIKFCVIIQMYNAYVLEEDLVLFLKRYCFEVSKGVKLNDKYGLWTGKWRFHVQLLREVDGGRGLPPRMFSLGPDKGRLYMPEIPEAASCWSCGALGHQSKDCSVKKCINCYGEGHYAKDCTVEKKCSLCGLTSHLFKACPKRGQSYAAAVGQSGGARGSSAPAPSAPVSVSVFVSPEKAGVREERRGETASHAAANAKPHGEQKGGKGTKELGQGRAPACPDLSGWGDSSQEAEMVEVAEGGVKRPSQDSEGPGTPLRRRRAGIGARVSGSALQEGADVSEDDVLLVEMSEEEESATGTAPGKVELKGGPAPKPPDEGSGKPLLPGFSEVLGAARD